MGRSQVAKAQGREREQRQLLVGADGVVDADCWMLVRSHVGQEKLAADSLRRAGFEVYLPMRLGQRWLTKDSAVKVPVPFWGGYLFARLGGGAERWQAMFSVRGVSRVMGLGVERPMGFRDEFVQGVRAREIEGYLQAGLLPGVPRCDLVHGEAVEVEIFGARVSAIFQHVDGRRATCLLSLLSSDSRVTVDLSRVARSRP